MADFYIAQGDLPLWTETLTDDAGNPVNINGAVVTMSMVPVRGGANVLTSSAVTNLDDGTVPLRGKVSRQMLAGETATDGDYLVRVVATQAGRPISFPNTGYFLWTVSASAVTQQRRYLGVEEFKRTANLGGLTYLDEEIDVAIEAASRGLEEKFNRGLPWTLSPDGVTRYFTRGGIRSMWHNAISITTIALDFNLLELFPGDDPDPWPYYGGAYSTTLAPTDYLLTPTDPTKGLVAAGGDGEPWRGLELVRGAVVWRLPRGRNAIRITGQFGYEVIPSGVKSATHLVAERFLRRVRIAPFGIASFGQDQQIATVRSILNDPDLNVMLDGVRPPKRVFM